jgi:hypothetical protein
MLPDFAKWYSQYHELYIPSLPQASLFFSNSTSLKHLPFPRLIFRLPPEQGSSITLQKFPQPSQPRSPLFDPCQLPFLCKLNS